MSNIIDFSVRKKANVTHDIIASSTKYYTGLLKSYNIDLENIETASDVAFILYLMEGVAHRSQGEQHPSRIIFDTAKKAIL